MLGQMQNKFQVIGALSVFLTWAMPIQAQEIELAPGDMTDETTADPELAKAQELVKNGNITEAFMALADVMAMNEDNPDVYQHAEFELGKILFGLDLPLSASFTFGDIAEAGEGHPHYFESIDFFLDIQQKVPGDTESLSRLTDYDPFLYPPGDADAIRFLVGRYHYSEDNLEPAIESLDSVEKESEMPYLRAQFLLGVIQSREGQYPEALESFKNVLRYQRDINDNSDVQEMAQRTTLAIARLFYTVQDFEKAVRYYDRIEQEDSFWLESLFEISWTHFQRGAYDRALGNLMTLNSPYFVESYHPEARILQAVILHTNCHFKDSLESVAQFVEAYKPLKEELEVQLKQTSDPNAFYRYLAQLSQQNQTTELSLQLKRVINAALADARLRRLLRHIVQMDREAAILEDMLEDSQSASARDIITSTLTILTSNRDLVVADAGQAAMTRIQRVYDELNGLLSQALRIKYETLRAQRSTLKQEKFLTPEEVAQMREAEFPPPSTDEEHMYWPFEGEYWRDELGAYTYLISNRCLQKGNERP